jgi:cob(I)alamin adenosyltransferase
LLQFIQQKPKNTELVLTGRGATPKVLELADYVSDINCVEHPFTKGIKSRKGIEF